MANYQNHMRYNRSGYMCQQRSSTMEQRQMQGRCADERQSRCTDERQSRCADERQSRCADERQEQGCGCRHRDRLSGMPLAMAYVPWQEWREIYDVCEGFQRGTVFRELDKPFLGRGGCNR